MGRKKKHNVNVGDVFYIVLSGNDKYSYGQVVSISEGSEWVVIFDITCNNHPNIIEIVDKPILFLVSTVTVKIEDGEWGYLGNTDIPNSIKYPEFICETLNGKVVLNYKGMIIRNANNEEIENLTTLKSCSPIILEDAVNAKFGTEEWYPYLDNLIYKN